MSLRLKLLVAVIALVFVGLIVADVATYTSLRSFLLRRVDQQLVAGQQPVAHELFETNARPGFPNEGGPPPALVPPGTFGEVLNAQGQTFGQPVRFDYGTPSTAVPALPSTLPAPSGDAPYAVFTAPASTGGPSYRVLARPFSAGAFRGTLIVAVPLSEVQQTTHRLLLIEGLVSVLVLVGLGGLSWWLVRRELRPLEEMGATAGAIAVGDLTRRVGVDDPRTEIGRLGASLNAMLAQIETAFAERRASEDRLRRFLADASHELRTPLTSIRGYAELFRRGAGEREEDLATSMRRIEDESKRMGVMVEDLLLLARLDQDRPLAREPVDLARIAADAAEDARATDGGRPISVETNGPVVVLGDDARLRQVAANLLSNAVGHTPAGTPVTVRAYVGDGNGVLEVEDHGPGIRPELRTKAFEPFFRADPSRHRGTGGAGLGLAIVAAIAKAHGGAVQVDETAGGGATFRVSIPRAEREQDAGV